MVAPLAWACTVAERPGRPACALHRFTMHARLPRG